jgi:Tfp pilus assembly major pilin PilA
VKKTNKTKKSFQRKHFAVTLAVILIVCLSALAALKIRYYNEASDQAGIVSIRGLILTAVQAVKKKCTS